MNKLSVGVAMLLLAGCQSTPKLEDDARYTKLAKVVAVHVYSDAERSEARKSLPVGGGSGPHMGFGFGIASGGNFGMMINMGVPMGGGRSRSEAPQVAYGADRYTVQAMGDKDRIEVLSYDKYKEGDCVKVMSGHPSEYARLYAAKAEERCE